MRKFVIQTKSNKATIFEVEIEMITGAEDIEVAMLPPGEYKARIVKPAHFLEKIEKVINGKREFVTVPPVWYHIGFYDTLESAQQVCADLVKKEFEFQLRKHGTSFTQEDIQAAIGNIQIKMLE